MGFNITLQTMYFAEDPKVYPGTDEAHKYATVRGYTRRSYKDKEGKYPTDFFNYKFNGRLATLVESLKKGSRITIAGELRNNNFKGKDGNMVYSDQIVVEKIEFIDKPEPAAQPATSQSGWGGYAPQAQPAPAPAAQPAPTQTGWGGYAPQAAPQAQPAPAPAAQPAPTGNGWGSLPFT